jgi:hypothetical protein
MNDDSLPDVAQPIWAIARNDGAIMMLVCQHNGCGERWHIDPLVEVPAEITSTCPRGHAFAARAMPWVPR